MQEFLDTEWYYECPEIVRETPAVKLLPTSVVMELAQPSRIREILLKDKLILDALRPDVARYGIKAPLIIKIDKRGMMTLFDGHHRVVIASEQSIKQVPVVFQSCPALSLEAKHITDMIHALVA